MQRRTFLQLGGQGLLAVALLPGCGGSSSSSSSAGAPASPPVSGPAPKRLADLGALGPADADGLRLPAGFQARVVARSGAPVPGVGGHVWHGAPDGGAVFAQADGGWVYVSNAELDPGGGVGALRFDANAAVVDAYPILHGTRRNCAGGATPWGTWLSCEEVADGLVWECDPLGRHLALARPALGRCQHEAAAVDPASGAVYLTEDEPDGRLYRFRPDVAGDLSAGELQVAEVRTPSTGQVVWHRIPDPAAGSLPLRAQVPASTAFAGGEGAVVAGAVLYFTTKGDDRVWALDLATDRLALVHDPDRQSGSILHGVDNITAAASGELVVAEDGGDMQLVVVGPDGGTTALLQVEGQPMSELTGPAFTPDMQRLYFSSQRGAWGSNGGGITWEVSGPFAGAG